MKKANMQSEAFEFIIAAAIISLALLVLIFAANGKYIKTFDVGIDKQDLNNDLFLINLLRSEYSGKKIQDILVNDFYIDNYDVSKVAVDDVLERAFLSKVCYRLTLIGQSEGTIEQRSGCTAMEDLGIGGVRSETIIPIEDGTLQIRLES